MNNSIWYYTLDGQVFGPFAADDVRGKLAANEFDTQTLVWTEGMGNWSPLADTPLSTPLPPPPAVAPLPPPDRAEDAATSIGPRPTSSQGPAPAARRATSKPQSQRQINGWVVGGLIMALAVAGKVMSPNPPAQATSSQQEAAEILDRVDPPADLWRNGWQTAAKRLDEFTLHSPIDGRFRLAEGTQVFALELSFLPDWELIRLYDEHWNAGPLQLYFLEDPDGDIHRLDRTSSIIGLIEDQVELSIANADNYLWFHNYFTKGEGGPFLMIESTDDFGIPRVPDNAVFQSAEAQYRPIDCSQSGPDFRCTGTLYYSNALYLADFLIRASGQVELTSEEPLATDLPVTAYVPVSAEELI